MRGKDIKIPPVDKEAASYVRGPERIIPDP
jgi:hypothetical protein